MGRVQYSYLTRKRSETGQDGTVVYDLPEVGFMPELVLRVFSTPTASTDPAIPINDMITKIDISDGGKTIKSVTGNQLHGLECIHRKHHRTSTELNDNAVEGYDEFLIIFSDVVNGVAYAPDMSRFANPQLALTFNNSQTSGQFGMTFDADATPAVKTTLLAKVVRGASKYTHGYVKSAGIREFTSAVSATVQVEVPTGEQLLGLMIEAGYDSLDWTEDIERLKIDFDNGAWIPFDLYEEEIVKMQEQWFNGAFSIAFRSDMKDGIELDSHMGFVTHLDAQALGTADQYTLAWPNTRRGVEEVSVYDSKGAADGTYREYSFHVVGLLPYQCWYVPMSALLDGDGDLINTNEFRRIIVEIVQGASVSTSSTPAVVGEWLVTA